MQLPEERFEEKTRWRTSSLTRSRCSRSCLLEEEELREEEREKQQPEEELDEELEERTRLRRRSLKEEEFEETVALWTRALRRGPVPLLPL